MTQISLDTLIGIDFERISLVVDTVDERDSVTKYRIRMKTDIKEYIFYRNYKQFHSFYSSLKQSFPRIELSSFPSKFNFLNKRDHRRKGFDKFLKNVIEIGIGFPDLAKKTLKKLLFEFFIENECKLFSATNHSKDSLVEETQIKVYNGIITGYVDLLLDSDEWITYYASLFQRNLYFFPDDNKDSYFLMMISCYGAEIIESDLEEVIEIRHPYEKRPILLRTKNWMEWKDNLVSVAASATSSKVHKNKSIGRVIVKIYSGQNIKLIKPAVSLVKPHVFVKVSLGELEYETSILPQEYLVNWNQTFIL